MALETCFHDHLERGAKIQERWCRETVAATRELRTLERSIAEDGQLTVEKITERLSTLNLQQKTYADEQEELSALQKSIILEDNNNQVLQERISELSVIRQRREQVIGAEFAAISEAISERREKNNSMLDAISWYEKNFGLRVEPSITNVPALRFIFTKLAPRDLDQEFSLCLRHDKRSNVYTLLECKPRVACSGELLHELNRTNDLQKFITKMHREFQAELEK